MHIAKLPEPDKYLWSNPRGNGKTKTAAATYAGKRIRFQLPPCRCRLFDNQGSHTLYLTLENTVQKQFEERILEYETYAATVVSALAGDGPLRLLSSIRSGHVSDFRLSVWETEWFDETGTYTSEAPTEMVACSCILEFQGVWIGSDTYGLKFRPVQIRAEQRRIPRDVPVCGLIESSDDETPVPVPVPVPRKRKFEDLRFIEDS